MPPPAQVTHCICSFQHSSRYHQQPSKPPALHSSDSGDPITSPFSPFTMPSPIGGPQPAALRARLLSPPVQARRAGQGCSPLQCRHSHGTGRFWPRAGSETGSFGMFRTLGRLCDVFDIFVKSHCVIKHHEACYPCTPAVAAQGQKPRQTAICLYILIKRRDVINRSRNSPSRRGSKSILQTFFLLLCFYKSS